MIAILNKQGVESPYDVAKKLKMRKGLVKRSETVAKKRKADAESNLDYVKRLTQ